MEQQRNINQHTTDEGGIDLKDLVYTFLAYWKCFAASLLACLFVAAVYLHYTMPTYRVSSKIMIRDEKRGGDFFSEISVFDDIDMFYKANTENEIELLKSKTLVKNVILERELYVNYYGKSFLRKRDITGKSPVVLVDSLFDASSLGAMLTADLKLNKDQSVRVRLSCEDEVLHDSLYAGFPVEVTTPNGLLDFALAEAWSDSSAYNHIVVEIYPPVSLAKNYIKNLNLSQVSKTSSIVVLTLKTTNKAQGISFLNGLIDMYNRSAVEEKNEVATKTALFIDNRIKVLTDELGGEIQKTGGVDRTILQCTALSAEKR